MAEHAGSAPQTAWRVTKLGAGGLLVLFALFLIRPDSEYIQQRERLEYEGRTVTAKVIGKIEGNSSPHTSLPPRGGGAAGAAARSFAAGKRLSDVVDGRDGQYYLEFQFTTPKGERIEDRGVVSVADFKKFAVGAELEVIYLPVNPTINRLNGYTEPFKRIPQSILLTVSFVVGSIGAFLIWRNWPFGAVVAPGGGDPAPLLDGVRGDSRLTRPVVANGELRSRRAQPQPARRRQGFGQRA